MTDKDKPAIDDSPTMNLRRREKGFTEARELRERLKHHSETLRQLADATPTKALRKRYEALRAEVEIAILHVNELDPDDSVAGDDRMDHQIDPDTTRPGMESKPDSTPKGKSSDDLDDTRPYANGVRPKLQRPSDPKLIVMVAAVVFTALLGWWLATPDREARAEATEQADAVTTPATEATPSRPPDVVEIPTRGDTRLVLGKEVLNWGTISRDGRIDAKVVAIANRSPLPVSLHVQQSECGCLLFDHPLTLAPGQSGELLVTIDRKRAGTNHLDEQVIITNITESTELGVIRVIATLE